MTKPSKEELAAFEAEVVDVAEVMAKAMFATKKDKRACVVASVRVAAGTAAMAGVDLHRAIHMFMTFYKEADQSFERDAKNERG